MRGRRFSIVMSDLHLGAGHSLPDGTSNSLEDFREDAAFAELLAYFDRLYLGQPGEWVSNGDFFETLFFSAAQSQLSHLGEGEALSRIRAIVDGHPRVFDALGAFAAGRRRRIVFVTGNHDPALYFRSVRRFLARRIGGDVRFHRHYHIADDTFVEHGHRFEESFRIRLRHDFSHEREARIELPWGSQFLTEYVMPLRREHPEMNKIYPLWPYVADLFRKRPLYSLRAFARFAGFVLRNRFSRDARLRRKFSRTFAIMRADSDFTNDLVPQARSLLGKSPFRALILGHTHHALDREVLPGRRYVNTGTWIDMARWRNGHLSVLRRLTFALVHERRADPAAQLLEWTPKGPVPFQQPPDSLQAA